MKVAEYRARVAAGRSEHSLQIEVVEWLERALPAGVVWSGVDHAAKLSPRQGANRKRMGVKRGMADLRFILPGGRSAEIELKRPSGGALSQSQKEWRDAVRAAGGLYEGPARSVSDVYEILLGWGIVCKREK